VFSDIEIRELQRELVGHCARLRDRIAILDPRVQDTHLQEVANWRRQFDSSYAALYFPWLRVPDPLHLSGLLRTVPPCGHIAGLYARVENNSGVHQPPANEQLENVRDLTVAVKDEGHGFLNERAINAIRAYPGRGLRPMGARTLSSNTQLRYVNVRRILLALERTLRMKTQWLVFEPNNTALQAEVARVLRGMLDDLWLRGMLDGATADGAYQVICDETSNPPAETEAGRLLAEIIIRPPYPAEFVVVRVGRTDQGIQFLEGSEA
jgi:phage tail sheath protein FI